MASELMAVIIEIENRLGWCPNGHLHRGRSLQHSILTKAMTKRNLTLNDLRLAIAYAEKEQIRIEAPVQLLGMIRFAKERVADRDAVRTGLDIERARAIAWENDQPSSDDSIYWLTRLGRAVGPERRRVLGEWMAAGRGR